MWLVGDTGGGGDGALEGVIMEVLVVEAEGWAGWRRHGS